MPVGYFGRCDGPGCGEWRKLISPTIHRPKPDSAPSGWAAVKVEVSRLGIPGSGSYVFHSRLCFLNWANATDASPNPSGSINLDEEGEEEEDEED
jgi:hypothetical protein